MAAGGATGIIRRSKYDSKDQKVTVGSHCFSTVDTNAGDTGIIAILYPNLAHRTN